MKDEKMTFESIGTIRTDYETPENMPIQGSMAPDATATLAIDPDYRDGLKDLETFSHLILIYYFHESDEDYDLKVEPFLEDKSHGVFATRAPRGPNPIGMTSVALDNVDGETSTVRGIDVLDGTPLLDIKPYVPEVDAHREADDGWIDGRMEYRHDSDGRFT